MILILLYTVIRRKVFIPSPARKEAKTMIRYSQEMDEQQSMQILHGLALELQAMDELQRLKTLKWVVQKESRGEGNRFWLVIVKFLLARPELISKALQLSAAYRESKPEVIDFQGLEKLTSNPTAPHNRKVLASFFQIFSQH